MEFSAFNYSQTCLWRTPAAHEERVTIIRCPLYRSFKEIFTGSKFLEFCVFWTILQKLVPENILAKLSIREIREFNSQPIINSSYRRRYHAYKDVWRKKPINMMECRFYISIFDDCISKKVVGYVPFNWSKLTTKFLLFPNHRIRVAVTGNRVNRRAEFGLEIPIEYIFYRDSSITT